MREPPSFQQRRNQDGYEQETSEHAPVRERQSHDLAERQRERPVLLDELLPTVQGSIRRVAELRVFRSPRPGGDLTRDEHLTIFGRRRTILLVSFAMDKKCYVKPSNG